MSTTAPPPRNVGAPSPRVVDRRLISTIGSARRALITSVVVGVILTITVIAQAFLLAHLLGWAVSAHPGSFPMSVLLGLLAALVARGIAGGIGESVAARAGAQVTTRLRASLFAAVIDAGPAWMAQRRTGALVVATTRGLRSLEPYFSRYLPAAVVAALAPPVALVALAITDWPSALLALVLVAIIPFAMIRLGRRAARESDRQWRRLSSLSTRALELLRGLPTLRSLGRVDRGRDELVAASDAVVESIDATLGASLASGAALEFIAGVGVGLVAMLAGLRLLNGSMSLVAALAVILVTPEVYLPLRRAGAEFHASTEGRAAAAALFDAIDSLPPASTEPSFGHGVAVTPVELDHLRTSYPASEDDALAGISLRIETGDHVVIKGPSGAGKTSVLMVLCGFLAPTGGELRFAGTPVGELASGDLRRSIALAPQRPHVFATTLRQNLVLDGRAESDATLREVLDLVGLSDLADGPAGLERALDEAGGSLSGGERQRLGLARVLLSDAPLVLLDEATAHLDAETIALLRTTLAPWLATRTVIEVSHRPGLLASEARVITLEHGARTEP